MKVTSERLIGVWNVHQLYVQRWRARVDKEELLLSSTGYEQILLIV
jgi:hypothetical protein